MAASEYEIIRDQQERDNLQRSIVSAETALAVSAPSTRRILENLIEGAQGRIATLDTKIKDEREAEVREQAAIALMAQKEAALTAREQAEYSGFLKEDFFTKRDFGRLEHFYAHAWDRLSEEGKDEMSHRVWEGIRHNEYRFDDLPKDVKEKEAHRLYDKITSPSKQQDSLAEISQSDRDEFVAAYRGAKRSEAYQILDRDCFRRNVAIETSKGIKHQTATEGKAADDQGVLADDKTSRPVVTKGSSAMANIKSVSEKLKDLTLDDSPPTPAAASIPSAGASQVNARSPG